MARPYIINFFNESTEQKTAVFPNLEIIKKSDNYGNPAGVWVAMGIEGITFGEFIYQASISPVKARIFAIECTTKKQHNNALKVFSKESPEGKHHVGEFNTESESWFRMIKEINFDFHFEFPIEPSSQVIFKIYPN